MKLQIINGLWHKNPAFVQLLGLCPLLAVSTTLVNGISLGLATLIILTLANGLISGLRHWIPKDMRLPCFVIIIAGVTTCIELLLQSFSYPLYLRLGIFIPLIITNCTLLARAESFASQQPVGAALLDGLIMGAGFALALIILSALREILGQGTLMQGMEFLLGSWARHLEIQVLPQDSAITLVVLAPGAFILTGFCVAIRNWLDSIMKKNKWFNTQ